MAKKIDYQVISNSSAYKQRQLNKWIAELDPFQKHHYSGPVGLYAKACQFFEQINIRRGLATSHG